MTDRRTFLVSAALALGAAGGPLPVLAGGRSAHRLRYGRATPYSFERLKAEAGALAAHAYVAPKGPAQAVLDQIDYAALGSVHFDTRYALYRDGPGEFPVTFFPLGKFFPTPVRMYRVERGGSHGTAREILYEPSYFDMPADSPLRRLPRNAGFAGFRFQESRLPAASAHSASRSGRNASSHAGPGAPGSAHGALDWRTNDWVAFLGASYFRAIGALYQYGLSARGIALDVAQPDRPEEFPAFTRFYFEPPADHSDTVVVDALLEGPSLTGAYRFVMQRTAAVLMDIEAWIFPRRDIARIYFAPLTSMYWFSETEKPMGIDWRPEVHDSDGLAMWTGRGERIWRPLNDPPAIATSAFMDVNPRGFGLLQRDRNFDHYLDGVHYERRPDLWVEPLGDWGEGAVQLIELPTDDEIHDNIVAGWVPKHPVVARKPYHLKYRLHWTASEPFPSGLAVCVATRLGRGGQPGLPRPKGVEKFMVEFLGGPLQALPYGVRPEAVLTASSGRFSYVFTEAVPDGVPGHWRAQFDYTAAGATPVDMRLYLRYRGQPLTETWLYQYHPALG